VPCRELDADHSAEAVPYDDGFVDPDLGAERSEVVGEVGDRVATFRAIAPSATAQVEGRDGLRPREVVELRLEDGSVTAPAVDEEQFALPLASPLVIQLETVEFRVRHLTVMVSWPKPRREMGGVVRGQLLLSVGAFITGRFANRRDELIVRRVVP
jgi:hypothetical protein